MEGTGRGTDAGSDLDSRLSSALASGQPAGESLALCASVSSSVRRGDAGHAEPTAGGGGAVFSARTKQGPHLCPSGTAPPRHPHCPHSWAAASQRRLHVPVEREHRPLSSRGTPPGCGLLPATPSTGGRGKGERKGNRRAARGGGSPAVTPPAPRARPPSGPLQAVTRALCTLPSEEARRPPAPQAPDASLAAWHPGGKATTSPPAPV